MFCFEPFTRVFLITNSRSFEVIIVSIVMAPTSRSTRSSKRTKVEEELEEAREEIDIAPLSGVLNKLVSLLFNQFCLEKDEFREKKLIP